ncbi:MAG: hypothetical protein ACW972_08855 [Promethearchaeota archaeon]|jgi:prefoldin subunit 5
MASIKELKRELTELRSTMDKLTIELHEINITIRDSLKMTSETIREMSKSLEATMRTMSDLTIQMNIRDTVLKSLGLDRVIPDFLKKKK